MSSGPLDELKTRPMLLKRSSSFQTRQPMGSMQYHYTPFLHMGLPPTQPGDRIIIPGCQWAPGYLCMTVERYASEALGVDRFRGVDCF